jgi:hypothetical protein
LLAVKVGFEDGEVVFAADAFQTQEGSEVVSVFYILDGAV